MGKKFKSRSVSVRGSKSFLYVTLIEDGKKIFGGGCNPRDSSKVSELFSLLEAKGLKVSKKDSSSWWE